MNTIFEALVLGRVEKLSGMSLDSNPFPELVEEWYAFREGWSLPVREPLWNILKDRNAMKK
jgi:hypothetical protein